jgi:hypothetical protein
VPHRASNGRKWNEKENAPMAPMNSWEGNRRLKSLASMNLWKFGCTRSTRKPAAPNDFRTTFQTDYSPVLSTSNNHFKVQLAVSKAQATKREKRVAMSNYCTTTVLYCTQM